MSHTEIWSDYWIIKYKGQGFIPAAPLYNHQLNPAVKHITVFIFLMLSHKKIYHVCYSVIERTVDLNVKYFNAWYTLYCLIKMSKKVKTVSMRIHFVSSLAFYKMFCLLCFFFIILAMKHWLSHLLLSLPLHKFWCCWYCPLMDTLMLHTSIRPPNDTLTSTTHETYNPALSVCSMSRSQFRFRGVCYLSLSGWSTAAVFIPEGLSAILQPLWRKRRQDRSEE